MESPFESEDERGRFRSACLEIVDGLPADATWDDLMERVYVRQAIEAGLKSAAEDELIENEEVRRRFRLAG